jgi:hypothetical protein
MAAMALALPAMACAATVGVFCDPAVEQIQFAAGDVKAALEINKFAAGSYHNEESPAILKRGIKLNLPLDLNSATYFSASRASDSAKQAIAHLRDMGFWAAWFVEMARNRYNVAGGWGVECYFGCKLPQTDLSCQDYRSRDQSRDCCRIGLEFFPANQIT